MLKIAVTGSRKDREKIIESIKRRGFEIDTQRPDFVVTYGGDGSILWAENEYPSVPKITLCGSGTSNKCMYKPEIFETVLEKIKKGAYCLKEEQKFEARFENKRLLALNEIQVRNRSHIRALRFSVFCKGEENGAKTVFENVIGDGVVIATPFGSTAYYSSVGGKPFKKGMGIALNNPHNVLKKRYFVAGALSEIRIKILRDEGLLAADNCEDYVYVKEGDVISVKYSGLNARFVAVESI